MVETAVLTQEHLETLTSEEVMDLGDEVIQQEQDRKHSPIKHYKANRAQEPFHLALNARNRIPKLRLIEAGNKVGKSAAGIIEGISFSLGYRPWLPENHPQHKTPVVVPNVGRIIAEDFPTGIQQNVYSLLKEWRPVLDMPLGEKWFKKNQAGYIAQIYFNNGSIIHLMSYDQDVEKFEGVDWDWTLYNEPPPRDLFIANERGKIARAGYSWMAYTPLKEPWLYDEIVMLADADEETMLFRGDIWDNWIGSEFRSKHTGKIHRGILSIEAIQEFAKRLTPAEKKSRLHGLWQHLEGLIFSEFDGMYDEETGHKVEHIVDDFVPPRDVMWIEGIDPHDKKSTCMLFGFVDKEDNMWLARQLVMERLTVPQMADKIIEMRAELRYMRPAWTVMDVKAGGWDLQSSRSMAIVEGFEKQFRDCGIFTIASDSRPGTIDSSIKIVREYLQPEMNIRTRTMEPKLRVMRKLREAVETDRGRFGCVHQLKRWQYDDKGEPQKKFDDFPAIIRYMCGRRPKYRSPQQSTTVTMGFTKPSTNAAGYG